MASNGYCWKKGPGYPTPLEAMSGTKEALLYVTCVYSVYIILFCCFCTIESKHSSFTMELIHRDSPKSPFYNCSLTNSHRLRNALDRTLRRTNHFTRKTSGVQGNVISAQGEYLLNISIGTPPFQILGIADTGSDLIWTQCNPCSNCFKQDRPLFDPQNSSSYKRIPCNSSVCASFFPRYSCQSLEANVACPYKLSYGDESFTIGFIAFETVTLGSTLNRPVSIPNVVFGCGHHNDGIFSNKSSGIVGLGGGAHSLISQMGPSIGGKFSYCLVPISEVDRSSKINFGSNAMVLGDGVVTTDLVAKFPPTYYYVTVDGFSVGDKRFSYYNPSNSYESIDFEGNMIIDSGTTLSLIPRSLYEQLELELMKGIPMEPTEPPMEPLKLCYKTEMDIDVPIVTVHFKGAADLQLKPINTFIRVEDDIMCFSFAPSDDTFIFGNVAQMNFLVGYDLEQRTISFKPTDCTK
ncbi:Xylanase inhibitor, N-terminal [Dillenia turbinata]|uniref:Xylanase inhibitor, N-terminal n=1 Tax=Dillenia turbinata TaxID=194707 RepID=A0AAN8UWC6_9MAGN